MKLTAAQSLMLNALVNAKHTKGIPVGLSDLSNLEFIELMNEGMVDVGWAGPDILKALITEQGAEVLAEHKAILK